MCTFLQHYIFGVECCECVSMHTIFNLIKKVQNSWCCSCVEINVCYKCYTNTNHLYLLSIIYILQSKHCADCSVWSLPVLLQDQLSRL